jgi:hypothetical protein
MSDENRAPERVAFSRGYGVCIMGIDGTWRRDCLLNAISDVDAILTVDGSGDASSFASTAPRLTFNFSKRRTRKRSQAPSQSKMLSSAADVARRAASAP